MRLSARAAQAGRLPLHDRLHRAGQVALLTAAVAVYCLMLARAVAGPQDFDTYLTAGRDLLGGHPLYSAFLQHPFPDPTLRPAYIYPPEFALLLAPFSLLPHTVAVWLWLGLTQAALAASFFLLPWRLRPSAWAMVLAACATLTFYPLWVDAVQGQANLLVMLLVVSGFGAIASGRTAGGFALGLAAALKLTPLLLLGWLAAGRRLRAMAWMALGFAAATAAGGLIRYQDTLTFFRDVAPALARGTAFYSNQSLAGVLSRLFTTNGYTTPWWNLAWEPALFATCSAMLAGWWLWTNRNEGDLLTRGLTFLPLLPLLSAVTWGHHLVILLPVLWLGIARLASRGWPALPSLLLALSLVCFDLLPRWGLGPAFLDPGFRLAQTADPLVLISANGLFLGTLILFLSAPWLLRSR